MKKDVAEDVAARVIDVDLAKEIEIYYAKYTTEAIENRALPDADDGLKPVQRRILTTMFEDKFLHSGKTHKSARVVGDVMGRYHPHSDASIYDALVRMAAQHTYRVPLIYGHGNFGSPQSGAAAYRYTECKLSEAGEKIVGEISDGVVQYKQGEIEHDEPVKLPAQFPNLIVNGSMGIAVAMSTNIPPHNLTEVIDATVYQLENQETALDAIKEKDVELREKKMFSFVDKLMKRLPGPDFPTGGVIIGAKEGVRSAFATGSGSIILQSKYKIEQTKGGGHYITFYSIPYGVNPTKVVDGVVSAERNFIATTNAAKELGANKVKIEGYVIDGLVEVNDATDMGGVRIVFKVKPRHNPHKVAAEILSRTPLESSYSYNMNALFNGVPRVASLPEILQSFINFRRKIVVHRSRHEKESVEGRMHLIDGLVKVIADIDKAYKIIRGSDTQATALTQLKKAFKIDDIQAKYILDTQLRKLTKYDSLELEKESESLHEKIDKLNEILSNKDVVDSIVKDELLEVKKWSNKNGFGERFSEIADLSTKEHKSNINEKLEQSTEIQDEPVTLYLADNGKFYRKKKPCVVKIDTSILSNVIIFGDDGQARRVPVLDLPNATASPMKNVVGVVPEGKKFVVFTSNGVVSAHEPNYPTKSDEFPYINLSSGDKVTNVAEYYDDGHIIMISRSAQVMHTLAEKVSVKASINGKGMAGMKLSDGDSVLYGTCINEKDSDIVHVYTSNEVTVKSTPLSEYPVKGRGTSGVVGHKIDGAQLVDAVVAQGKMKVKVDGAIMELPKVEATRAHAGAKIPWVSKFLLS